MTLLQLLEIPAWAVIAATSLPRVKDITRDQWSIRWHARRAAFVVAGTSAIVMLAALMLPGPAWLVPTARTAFVMSVAVAWLTTPHLPPWWLVFSAEVREELRKVPGLRARLLAEWGAMRRSFVAKSAAPSCPKCGDPK